MQETERVGTLPPIFAEQFAENFILVDGLLRFSQICKIYFVYSLFNIKYLYYCVSGHNILLYVLYVYCKNCVNYSPVTAYHKRA